MCYSFYTHIVESTVTLPDADNSGNKSTASGMYK